MPWFCCSTNIECRVFIWLNQYDVFFAVNVPIHDDSSKARFSAAWSNYALKKTKAFPKVLSNWLKYCWGFVNDGKRPQCILINYKDLVNDTLSQMKTILEFLKLPVNRLHCLDCDDCDLLSGPFRRGHTDENRHVENTLRKPPLCMLKKSVQRLLTTVTENVSATLRRFHLGESFSQELERDMPMCDWCCFISFSFVYRNFLGWNLLS